MKQELYLHIPQPCHEDWNNMTPVDKGKFCNSCSKQVVDFSNMTDYEVLNFFTKSTGKVCGRFANDQLQRPLQPIKIEKKKTWWIAAMMPFLLLFGKASAQKKKPAITDTSIVTKNPQPIIMGKVAPRIIPDTTGDVGLLEVPRDTVYGEIKCDVDVINNIITPDLIVMGRVVDEKGEALPFATVVVTGKSIGFATDASGFFRINISDYDSKNILLSVSYIGYESKEIHLLRNGGNGEEISTVFDGDGNIISREINVGAIMCNPMITGLGKIIVVGGAFTCKRVTHKQIIDTTIRKVFQGAAFKSFPNPAVRGSQLHVDTKKAGEYSILLFDNNSKLLLANDFTAIEGATVSSISIPSTFASGTYYIRLVDNKKKKQSTDKIIIQ